MDRLYQLLQSINSDTLLLTANKRLSGWLYKQLHALQKTTPYETPNILPIQTWLGNCWNEALIQGAAPDKTLLSPSQTKLLWQNIVIHHNKNALLHITGTAEFAEKAWALIQAWKISINDKRIAQTESGRTFQQWAKQFEQQGNEEKWLDPNCLMATISSIIHSGKLKLPKQILLLGFLEKSPALQQLIDTLKEKNINVDDFHHHFKNGATSRIALQDLKTEITTMARWAKAQYQAKPKASIACIVPELNRYRTKIERIFSEVFEHKNNLFNISSGEALLKEPMIEIAFSLLNLKNRAIHIHELSHLLRSPFILEGKQRFTQRARLDEEIRSYGNLTYSLPELLKLIHDKTLSAALNNLYNQKIPNTQSPSSWTQTFLNQLKYFGWPGERGVNSREYQAITQCMELLKEFAQLDKVTNKITYVQALQLLRQMLVRHLFQPQTTDAQVQVLGMLEITGITFDYAWVMGLDHQSWPSKPKPNPFIPIQLQRDLQMPHASSDRELAFCELMTDQFLHCAEQVICSFSMHLEDQHLLPSPLIQSLPEINFKDCLIAEFQSHEEALLSSETLEHLTDNQAPQISKHEKVRGGTSIFKLQAACPFHAYATLRLQSETISEPESGLDALNRGILTHVALELFWRVAKTQSQLLEYSDEEAEKLIKWSINKAATQSFNDLKISKAILNLEKERQLQIIKKWLEIEKQRKPFKVAALEQWQRTKVGKVSVTMKTDRIDQLENDLAVVIDYKTGSTTIGAWFGERLDEPQLPLYAISTNENIGAIAFAQLKSDQIRFKGVACEAELLPGVSLLTDINYEEARPSWQEQLNNWRKNLEAIADDFYNGEATVDPKDPNKTCRNCNLQTFCRIYEKISKQKETK